MSKVMMSFLVVLLAMASGCGKGNSPNGGWKQVYQAPDDVYYKALCFPDDKNGWLVGGSGRIMHSVDGGDTWEIQESGTSADLVCVYFISGRLGWVGGSDNMIGRTTDGGVSWAWGQPEGESRRTFMAVSFLDESVGWTVDNLGGILHTEDGGITWTSQDSGIESALTSIQFLNAQEGWAVSTDRKILHTTDGGGRWIAENVRLKFIATSFNDVFFIDSNTGWIATGIVASSDSSVTTSPLLHTTDGGATWSEQASLGDMNLNSARFANQDVGWVVGFRSLFYTSDGGSSWSPQLDSGGDPFVSMSIIGDLHAWALTFTGRIHKYQT